MVDFQSRDTRVTGGGDEGADEPTGDESGDERHGGDERDHHHHHDVDAVSFAVLTVSSSRTADSDASGDAIQSIVEDAGHEVVARELVADDFDRVQAAVKRLVEREGVEAIVTTGGTGVTPDDVTPDAVRPLLDRHLPGFGELFRRLSYDEIGTRVVGTRADGGVASGVPVFCLPGSEGAVRLGVGDVILPEISHLVGLARRAASVEETSESVDEDDASGTDEE